MALQQRKVKKMSDANGSVKSGGETKSEDEQLEELDFLEMLGRLQSSRLDDQRSILPVARPISKSEVIEEDTAPATMSASHDSHNDDESVVEPIQQVLALGPPYPLVVLPVEGDYWMEGTNHIERRDRHSRPITPNFDLSKCVVESDYTSTIYRENFLGREHLNYAAADNRFGPMLLSVKCKCDSCGPGKQLDARDYYEVILRLKEKTLHQIIPSALLSENPRPREIIQHMLQDEVDVERFHPIAIPKITEHIVRYDEHVLTNCYKIGVIYQKHGQTTEEEYFRNKVHSNAMEEFLESIGIKVRLKGFEGYRGGLDVRHNQTGELSYHTVFREREFMFHVSTLLPYKPEDRQQVQRKRHIGNDIVAIVFQDENTPFSPTSVRSHFLHVFIVVQAIDANTPNARYKVSVTARDGVPHFGPNLPNPAIFRKGREFREFLMTKILNAELAACKSEKFSQLAERTRAMLLQQLVSDLITKNDNYMEDGMLTRTYSGGKGGLLSSFRSALANSKARNGSSQSLNSTASLQAQKNGLSLSLEDIRDTTGEETKKEKRKLFSRSRASKETSTEERKESHSSLVSPSTPRNSNWVHSNSTPISSTSMNGEKDFFGFRSKSVESAQSAKNTTPAFEGSFSANTSPSMSSDHRRFHQASDVPNTNRLGEKKIKVRSIRSSSFNDSDSLTQKESSEATSNRYVSESSCSSYDGMSSSSACSALDAAQREIDVLRSEINKLKTDKMNLVRQNVVYQREIKRYKEKSLQQTAQLYAAQHELAKQRLKESQEENQKSQRKNSENGDDKLFLNDRQKDINHNQETSNQDNLDEERTPIRDKEEIIFFTEDSTPTRFPTKLRSNTYIGQPLAASVSNEPSRGYGRISSSSKRHSVSHV